MENVQQGVIIGGSGNRMASVQAFIGGGIKNKILGSSSRGVILGGEDNQISTGESSTIIGGIGNTIQNAVGVTVIGNHNTVSGANAFVLGSGVRLTEAAAYTFARNDGRSLFTVSQPNIFAVNAGSGVVVGKDTPSENSTLSISGDLRIAIGDKNAQITKIASNRGVIKSVLTTSGYLA